jgi:hypothetical protein
MDPVAAGGRPPTPTPPPFRHANPNSPGAGSSSVLVSTGSREIHNVPGRHEAWRAGLCPVGIPSGGTKFRRSQCRLVHRRGSRFSGTGRPPGHLHRGDPQSRLSDVRTRGANDRPLRLRSAGTTDSNDRTVDPVYTKTRRFHGLLAETVRHRPMRRSSELPRRIVPEGHERTRLQGFQLRKSPCIHPPGVT